MCLGQNTLVSSISEFESAVSSAQPGDTIFLRNGTWNNANLKFYSNGLEDNPIVLSTETPGEVILTGSSRLRIYGEHLVVRDLDFQDGSSSGSGIVEFRKSSSELATNCRLTNCRILDFNPVSDDINYKWVSIYGENNRVDHCSFDGKNHEGALLVVWLTGQPNYHRIDHNYFTNIPHLGRNGGETIRIGTSANSMTESRSIVEHNLFESCDGEIEIISNKSNFNIYRHNTFRNNDGMLTLRHGNDNEVYGNFFFGGPNKASGGVRIIGERHKVYNNYFQDLEGSGFRAAVSMMNGVPNSPLNRYFQVKDALVINNTIIGCKEPFAFGEGNDDERTLPPLDCIVANNAVDETIGSVAVTYTDTPINMTYLNNYIDGSIGVSENGLINATLGFEESEDLLRPSEGSPLVNAGSLHDLVAIDIDGQTRDGNPDVGADEISSESVIFRPLMPEDVGYYWPPLPPPPPPLGNNEVNSEHVQLVLEDRKIKISGLRKMDLPAKLFVHDLQGRLIKADTFSTQIFEVPANFSGIYILSLIQQSGTILVKRKVKL